MDVVIGMLFAFILGAYIRQPIQIKESVKKKMVETVQDEDMREWLKQQEAKEKERTKQLFDALNWNGEKVNNYED